MKRGSPVELLHPRLRRVMEKLGYSSLLPVQERSIPVVMRGIHTLIVAPTGSGKTEAALFPVLSMMLSCRERGGCRRGVLTVYITPLRALNRDIESRIRTIVEESGFTVMVRHGDTTPSGRRRFAREAPEVMITTPESLNLLLTVPSLRGLWENVRWVIVDEIHEFIDSERGSELAVILERLQEFSRHRIQRIGLSATISRRTMRRGAAALLAGRRNVEIVVDDSSKRYDISVVSVPQDDGFWSLAAEKIGEIASSVEGKVLVFVNTRSTAEMLGAELRKITGLEVVVHHGSLSRSVREDAEHRFKHGNAKIMVATSSMELGVDIGDVELVIQFLSPRSVITMTQRAGRAGHKFGITSRAIIVTSDNVFELLESSVIAFRVVKGVLEDQKIHVNPLDALAHQIAGLVLERSRASRSWLYQFVTRAAPFWYLSEDDLDDVIMHLDSVRILRISEDLETVGRGGRVYKYFYNVSMIPDERNYSVYDILSGEKIGELSERFVEARLIRSRESDRFAFILAGKMWEALDVDPEKGRIEARLIGEPTAYVPSWEGELIPVDYKVSREVCSILSLCMEDENACRRLLRLRNMEEDQIEKIVLVATLTARAWEGPHLSPRRAVIEPIRGGVILHVCLGSKGNFALALLLSSILKRMHIDVVFDYIPYAIVFTNPMGVSPESVARALREAREMDEAQRLSLIEAAVRESVAYTLRFLQVARRMGVVDPDKALPRELARRIVSAYKGTPVDRETLREIVYDKLDYNALNEFLSSLEDIVLVPPVQSPLSQEVIKNPYLRKDKAVDLKKLALDTLIESYKKRLRNRRVILLCATCGKKWEATAASIGSDTACPKCGSRYIAVLPTTEWGERVAEIYKKYIERVRRSGRVVKPRGEAAKAVREVKERAQLFLEYYRDGLVGAVVAALLAPGVGPVRARRIVSVYLEKGEKEFYKELFRAMEEYAANRKYWGKKSRGGNR